MCDWVYLFQDSHHSKIYMVIYLAIFLIVIMICIISCLTKETIFIFDNWHTHLTFTTAFGMFNWLLNMFSYLHTIAINCLHIYESFSWCMICSVRNTVQIPAICIVDIHSQEINIIIGWSHTMNWIKLKLFAFHTNNGMHAQVFTLQ